MWLIVVNDDQLQGKVYDQQNLELILFVASGMEEYNSGNFDDFVVSSTLSWHN